MIARGPSPWLGWERRRRARATVASVRGAAVVFLALVASTCVVVHSELRGYACDAEHACATGDACVDNLCVLACDSQVGCASPLECREGGCVGAGPRCGDEAVDVGEACDDGNLSSGDGCGPGCVIEAAWTCGDNPSVCNRCGDGVIQGVEGCDDGDRVDDDGCDGGCVVEPGFACDGAPSACASVCGDGIVTAAHEQCDDADNATGDGCSAGCAREPGFTCAGAPSACAPICGDGVSLGAEACDDGGLAGGDGCSAACALEPGYTCSGTPSSCSTACGDGVRAGDEECDDGGANSDLAPNACRTSCALPGCGDGVVDGAEPCDDGDIDNSDACLTTCAAPTCGDGFVGALEGCDDGNATDADGCSACSIDAATECGGAPSLCVPAATALRVGAGEAYATIGAAVDAAADGDTIFVAAQTYGEGVEIDGKDVRVVAEPGAVIVASGTENSLRVRGAGVAEVRGLTIRHAAGQNAIKVEGDGSQVTVLDCVLGPTGKFGVESQTGTSVTLERTLVIANDDGGLKVAGAYSVKSSALVGNGLDSANVGGADFTLAGVFRFNTVAGNLSDGEAAGVRCQLAGTLVEASLFVENGAAPDTSAGCDARTSVVGDIGLLEDDRFHLRRRAPTIDAADALVPCPQFDIDRDPRPLGSACDPGADERP